MEIISIYVFFQKKFKNSFLKTFFKVLKISLKETNIIFKNILLLASFKFLAKIRIFIINKNKPILYNFILIFTRNHFLIDNILLKNQF